MEMLKVLILVNLVIIIQNSCNGHKTDRLPTIGLGNHGIDVVEHDTDVVEHDTIVILKSQYKILNNVAGVFDLEIQENNLVDQLIKIKNPILKIEFEDAFVFARGNYIVKSSIPDGFDYFFFSNKEEKIILKDKKIIYLRKVMK